MTGITEIATDVVEAGKGISLADVVVGVFIDDPATLSATVTSLADGYKQHSTAVPAVVFYKFSEEDGNHVVDEQLRNAVGSALDTQFTIYPYNDVSDAADYVRTLAKQGAKIYIITDNPKAIADANLAMQGNVIKVYEPDKVNQFFTDLNNLSPQSAKGQTERHPAPAYQQPVQPPHHQEIYSIFDPEESIQYLAALRAGDNGNF